MISASNTMLVTLLAGEQVLARVAPEALEAALGVRHVAGDPGAGDRAEDPAQQPPMRGLAGAPVRAVRLDAAAQGDLVVQQLLGEQRDLVGRAWPCRHP